jgi:hypothetical protein
MRRGIRIALAGTIAAGAVLAGAGTAFAGVGMSPSHHDDSDHKKDCSLKVDKDPKPKESDYPSDTHFEAYKNTTDRDAKDLHGKPYYVHNKFCQGYANWRDWDDDKSYDTFKFSRDPGSNSPSRDPKKNSYLNPGKGYNKELRKESKNERSLNRDHIGAPKNPKFATE